MNLKKFLFILVVRFGFVLSQAWPPYPRTGDKPGGEKGTMKMNASLLEICFIVSTLNTLSIT